MRNALRFTPAEIDTLCHARSVIRDLAMGWPIRELAGAPEEVCAALSDMIGDKYDFETSTVEDGEDE